MPNEVDDHGLALSADAKPRLKWTQQLHQRFVDAVSQLGGPDKATPKSVMQIMGIPGITLHHLKSHLQKYRLAKNKYLKAYNEIEADAMAADYSPTENVIPCVDENKTQPQSHKTMLQLQLEVQRKLQEQFEVQKHLQLRIEAQGKYLQSVVRKAQETLANYSLSSMEVEAANSELSELVSAVHPDCLNSSFSQSLYVPKQSLIADCSPDSCLTCSDRVELKNGNQHNLETSDCSNNWNCSDESSEMNPRYSKKVEMESGDFSEGAERMTSMHQIEESVFGPGEIDLNR